jgi:hypothetical protein
MDLFQILIILFILFPLLQRLFGGGKQKGRNQPQQRPEREESAEPWQRPEQRTSGSDNWEDALRELESIFTGEPVRRIPPGEASAETTTATGTASTPRTVDRQVPGARAEKQTTRTARPVPASGESTQLRRQRELQERFDKTRRKNSILDELEDDEGNAIFQSIDRPAGTEEDEQVYSRNAISEYRLDDPEELKRHLIIKEILDKPLSKRGRRHHLPV